VLSVTQRGNKGVCSLVSPTPGTPYWSLFGFTKQSQSAYSLKPVFSSSYPYAVGLGLRALSPGRIGHGVPAHTPPPLRLFLS
jgi:hypothetical protein